MTGRLVVLLLVYLLTYAAIQVVDFVFFGLASVAPGAALPVLGLAAAFGARAAQFFAAGFLFTLVVGLPWKRSGLWTWAGITLCNMLAAGPGAFSPGALVSAMTTFWGLAALLVSGAAAFYGCRFLEEREHRPWVEEARRMILGMLRQ